MSEIIRHMWLPGVCIIAAAYLLGSINFSIIFTRLFKNQEDIRRFGSGNAGATNVLRTVGKGPAALTFIFDFLKCVAAAELGKLVFSFCAIDVGASRWMMMQCGAYVAGLACILGHIFPVWFGFRGGKGVVTCAAMMCMTDWKVLLVALAVFIIAFICSKIVSLSSILAAASFPIFTFIFTYFVYYRAQGIATFPYVVFTTLLSLAAALIIIVKHHENISRLRAGTEKKIQFHK